jgi:putative drug exporter of the RND superfamily
MSTLTRFVLKHKLLVIAFWLILALAGAMTATSTTKRLTSSFAMPGAAFRAEARIQGLYAHDGAQDPTVPVITLPPGTRIHTPGVDRQLDHAFAAARQIIPTARVADYTTTHDPAFATRDGRSTYALVFTPQTNPIAPGDLTARIQRAITAAAPSSWQVRVTGIQALATSAPASKGAGVLAEAMLGALGAVAVLAFVFASFLAFVPPLIAAISVLTTSWRWADSRISPPSARSSSS